MSLVLNDKEEEPEIPVAAMSSRTALGENDKEGVAVEMAALLRRIEQLERLTGLPAKTQSLTRCEILRNWLINTVNIKLHLLGNITMATLIAILVLIVNAVFIVVFSKWQIEQCVATTSVIEADFNPKTYREFFGYDKIGTWQQEIFLCHSESLLVGQYLQFDEEDLAQAFQDPDDDLIVTDDGFVIQTSPRYKACTLPGFSYTDYDTDNLRCPPVSNLDTMMTKQITVMDVSLTTTRSFYQTTMMTPAPFS